MAAANAAQQPSPTQQSYRPAAAASHAGKSAFARLALIPYARGAPPPLARAAALEDSLSSRGPQALSNVRGPRALFRIYFELEDDFDDDLDEDDDFDDDEGGDEEDSEEDDEDADTETWQVSSARRFR